MRHNGSAPRLLVSFALLLFPIVGCGEEAGAPGGSGGSGDASQGGTSSGGGLAGNAGTRATGGDTAASGGTTAGAAGRAGSAGSSNPGSSGSSSGGAAGTGQAGGPVANGVPCDAALHTGEGTYYSADGSGNCSFDKAPDDSNVAAMNATDYAASATCGTCLAIKGPKGSVRVRVVDQCPECKPGDVDLHPGAFAQLADLDAGRVKIEWTYVSCETEGPIRYHFKEGSNAFWTAVQIRNHANAIAKVEYRAKDGSYKPMLRESYNYFVEPSGLGDEGPYTLRVTDSFGSVIEDDNIPHIDSGPFVSTKQFPACSP